MTRRWAPLPAGMKALALLTAAAGCGCFVVAVLVGIEPPSRGPGIDESAGLAAGAAFLALLLLACAVGLSLRQRWARALWLVLDLLGALPWSLVFALVSAGALAKGDPVVPRWLAYLLFTGACAALSVCCAGAWYLALGPGRRALARAAPPGVPQ